MVKVCDVVTINAPLHPETDNLFNGNLLSKMKRGACLVSAAAVRFAIGTQSSAPSKAPNSQAVRATYGSRSRLPRITPGGLCHIAA
jgi:hypothetical protein